MTSAQLSPIHLSLGGPTETGRPRFTLLYLSRPSLATEELMPEGTCLALRNNGPDEVTRVLVDPNDRKLAARSAARLPGRGILGLCSLDDVDAYAATRMVFIDWTDRKGAESTTWLRLPPVPRGIRNLLNRHQRP